MIWRHTKPIRPTNRTGRRRRFWVRSVKVKGVCVSETADCASLDDSYFELPPLQEDSLEPVISDMDNKNEDDECKLRVSPRKQIHGSRMDMDVGAKSGSVRVEGSGNDKLVPFDIDNGSARDSKYIEIGHRLVSPENSRSDVSVAIALKTLFFILVWYTVGTILTLYNKALLGDDMGRFPAPLLMNTVHFAMQAVLSKAITWFWSQRFQPSAIMSWSDYFSKVLPTALGTALDINLSNASLVFISVTFATMCKSASPIFLLLFAFAFRLESPSIKLLVIILVISVGILLTGTYGFNIISRLFIYI